MTVLAWVVGIALLAVALKLTVRWVEPRVAFRPQTGATPPPPGFSSFSTATADGVRITGWHSRLPATGPVLLYFCGNAGNLADRTELLSAVALHGLGVVAFNYRGTGESDGSPSEAGVYLDAEAAHAYMTASLGVAPHRIVLWGHSIGGAVATELATRRPCAGLILEAAFRSAARMGQRIMFGLPVGWAMDYRFDNEANLAKLHLPVLIMHGTDDKTVPVEDASVLFAIAMGVKELWPIPGGRHNDLYQVAGENFFDRLAAFSQHVTEKSQEENVGAGM
ncbi:MAG: alpha/beta hydrolase [Candidatus Zixiibacteriota bacterium]